MQHGTEIRVGDDVELQPILGEAIGRIVRLQCLFNERLASGSDCMLANASRFERPQVCYATQFWSCLAGVPDGMHSRAC